VGFEDITTNALIDERTEAVAQVVVKEDGRVAGLNVAEKWCEALDLKWERIVPDGDFVRAGSVVMKIQGPARKILSLERTLINLLSRMSGIATLASRFVEKAKKVNPHVKIAATRKTTPGFRFFEKEAVRIGGGDPHRYRLDDCVLIKDNHLAIVGGIKKAVALAREKVSFSKKIEIEVTTPRDALVAARAGADIVMLDNMTLGDVKKAIELLKKSGLRDKVLVEVSGGINLANVAEYAACNPDVISVGALTHSAKILDMRLELKKR
jgi:nicotinate-nucleotide pyrophosphorylase (carboxylating)